MTTRSQRPGLGQLQAPVIAGILVLASCGGAPATVVGDADGVSTDPVVTIPATVVPTPSAAPSTTVGVPTTTEAGSSGGPSVATEGFCVDLAAESGRLTVQVERLVRAGDGNEARNLHALLSASGDLLAWAAEAAPADMAPDVGLLDRVYSDLGSVLDGLDPETVTLDRLRGELFMALFESPVADGEALDLAARNLSAFVDRSCGPGYPLMEALADLFSADRGPDVVEAVFEFPDR